MSKVIFHRLCSSPNLRARASLMMYESQRELVCVQVVYLCVCVCVSLQKEPEDRPRYDALLQHAFVGDLATVPINTSAFVSHILDSA